MSAPVTAFICLLEPRASVLCVSLWSCLHSSCCPSSIAAYIVRHVTGTRFALLNGVDATKDSLDKVQAWAAKLHLETQEALSLRNIGIGHPLLGRMLDAPGQQLTSAQLAELGITIEQRNALVSADVLAAHTDKTFTCASRHVVGAFEALRAAPAAAAASASR